MNAQETSVGIKIRGRGVWSRESDTHVPMVPINGPIGQKPRPIYAAAGAE